MREDYLKSARLVIDDPMILINVVSRRVKQLRQGSRPLVESLEKLGHDDVALREIAEGKITYKLGPSEPDVPDVAPYPRNVRESLRAAHRPKVKEPA